MKINATMKKKRKEKKTDFNISTPIKLTVTSRVSEQLRKVRFVFKSVGTN